MKTRRLIAALATATLFVCPLAKAGGFDELPDQGAQALGRGAAFTAKADDATALYWNVAGIARQRGTKLQISSNLHFNSFYFKRAGSYPDNPTDTATPWGGKSYPVVEDKDASFLLPMLTATTDFGVFDRLTFGAGIYGPAATGRTFPIGVKGMPAPSRYDFVQSQSAVIFPTLGAAYRVTPQIDVGISGHLVMADLNQLSIAYADLGGGSCKTAEDSRCDAEGRLEAKGTGAAASLGMLARPWPSLQIGAQLRTPASVTAEGKVSTKIGKPSPASVTLDLPWMLRAGVRYIGMTTPPARNSLAARSSGKPNANEPLPTDAHGHPLATFEAYDVELDATYEAWGSAQATGPVVTTGDLTGASDKPTKITSLHKWNDTISVRVGGAYNIPLGDAILTVRAGAFYDSPTTDNAYTRLDVNTLAKAAGTFGLGFKTGAFTVNVAYAAVGSVPRTVTDGDIRPSNGAKEGRSVDGNDNPLPAVNNGEYRGFTHILSFGIQINFEAFFRDRRSSYGDPTYEAVSSTSSGPAPVDPPKSDDDEAHRTTKERTVAMAEKPAESVTDRTTDEVTQKAVDSATPPAKTARGTRKKRKTR